MRKIVDVSESEKAKAHAATFKNLLKDLTAVQCPAICKTMDEVDNIIKSNLTEHSSLSLQEQYELWNKVHLLALQGEANATIEELIPSFEETSLNNVLKSDLVLNLKDNFIGMYYGYDYSIFASYGTPFDNSKIEDTLKEISNLYAKYNEKEVIYKESKCLTPKPPAEQTIVQTINFDHEDIIITDPCYVEKWMTIKHQQSTLYGDWGCTIYNKDKEKVGQFCSDSGQVCCESLNRCKAINLAKLKEWVAHHRWCATIIENFTGKVEYVIKKTYFAYDGNWKLDESLIIQGVGTKEEKPFEFSSLQTSF